MRKALWAVAFLMGVMAQVAPGQVWDRSGNSQLSGAYVFREVAYVVADNNGDVSDIYGIFGAITFDGRGNYTVTGTYSEASTGQSSTYSDSGTYSLAASGYGFMKHPFVTTSGATMNILFSNGVLMGTSPEAFVNDLLFAVPSGSQTNASFNGSYSLAYLNVASAYTGTYDTSTTLNPNGNGGIGSITTKSYIGSQAAPINQTENSVSYSFSNNTGTLRFPTTNGLPLRGNMQFYVSADGNFIFGGAAQGFDLFVGVRRGSSAPPAMSGLYYSTGLNHNQGDLDTFFGAVYAYDVQGAIWEHQRFLASNALNPVNYTAAGHYQNTPGNDYTDTDSGVEYVVSQNAEFRIGIGQSPYMSLRIAVKAPTLTAPGGTAPWINPTGVQNAASSAPFTAGVSHGELITIYGANLASTTAVTQGGIQFPTTLAGVQVMMNNTPAAIYYVSPTQVSVIVPYGLTGQIVQIQVVSNNVTSNAVTEFLYTTGPGLFTESTQGQGLAKILHGDYRQVTPDNPAVPGEVLQVFLTGLGDVFPSVPDGALGPVGQLAEAVASIGAAIDNIDATPTISYAGLAPGLAGLYQMNFAVPSGVSNGDVYADISGPDSYTSQATIPIIGGAPPREAKARVHRR